VAKENIMPMEVSCSKIVFSFSKVISSPIIIVNGTAIYNGSTLNNNANPTPPSAECDNPLPKKLILRCTTNTPNKQQNMLDSMPPIIAF
jgi:hypothetical protein